MTQRVEVIYRKAQKRDLQDVVNMWCRLLRYHIKFFPKVYVMKKKCPAMMKKWFAKNLVNKNSFFMVAESDGKIIGYILLHVQKFRPPVYKWKKAGNLDDLFVEKEYRQEGVAKRLYSEAEEFAEKKGADFLQLRVDVKNKSANSFYDKAGFFDFMTTKMVKLK